MNYQVCSRVALGGLLLLLVGCQAETDVREKELRPVQVLSVAQPQNTTLRSFVGVVESQQEAAVSFRVPGVIQHTNVVVGDFVEKGQILARLDPHDYEVNIAELEARLSEAVSAQRLSTIEFERAKSAQQADAIADVDLDRARSALERASASVEIIQRNIQKGQDALGYTYLIAPFSGVVATKNRETFEQVSPGEPVFQLHQPQLLQVSIDVPERLIGHFERLQEATVWNQRLNIQAPAIVTEIATKPDLLKRTFPVKLALDSDYGELLPGQTVDVSIVKGVAAEGVCLPYSSIVEYEGQPSLFIARESEAHSIPVEHVEMNSKQVCVVAGLQKGDQVIVSGADYLVEGQKLGELQEMAR